MEILHYPSSDGIDYAEVTERIKSMYTTCNEVERKQLHKILVELSEHGYSQTYEQIWLADFKEVPVSIDQFLCDSNYLGNTNDNGNMVYPGWRPVYRDVFNSQNEKHEVILSGATRIGKTSTAVSMMAYMTYLIMCYRNPQKYFGLKAVSRVTVAFANLTKDLAAGVGFREYNDTLKRSHWFNEHGTFTNSATRPIYIPEGNQIELVTSSDAAHLLGLQLWCLVGDTQIVTSNGVYTLQELVGREVDVLQYDYQTNQFNYSTASVLKTKDVMDTIRITLEDGSVIEGTPEHLVMLSDGSYKALGDLTEEDDLMSVNSTINGLDAQWKPWPTMPDRVLVSEYGDIYVKPYTKTDSLGRKYTYGDLVLKTQIDKCGYAYVEIPFNRKKYKIHRLVAETFIPNPSNNPQVNHIDGNKSNNHISNLEWVTSRENIKHAYATGLRDMRYTLKQCAEMSSANQKRVRCLTTGEVFESINDAAQHFKLSHTWVSTCIKLGKSTSSGLQFEFIDSTTSHSIDA